MVGRRRPGLHLRRAAVAADPCDLCTAIRECYRVVERGGLAACNGKAQRYDADSENIGLPFVIGVVVVQIGVASPRMPRPGRM
jgi:hypothetical protein